MATQIPKLITNVEPYFRYEGEANATTQDQFQGFLKNEHSVLAVLTKGIWQPTTAYEIGDIINSPNMPKGFHAIAQTKGNSGANEPTWGNGTTNVSDGTVSWKLSKGDITVNGVGADSKGNIQLDNVNYAEFSNQATTAKRADRADASIKANQDNTGQIISSTYIKDVSAGNNVLTITKGNGSKTTINIKDSVLNSITVTGSTQKETIINHCDDTANNPDIQENTGGGNRASHTVIESILQGVSAGTKTLQSLLQELVNSSHKHHTKYTIRRYNCNCNCDCGDTDSGCIIKGNILTTNGYVDIKNLNINDKIIYNNMEHNVIAIKTGKLGNRKAITIAGLNSVVLTDEHQILLHNGDIGIYNLDNYINNINEDLCVDNVVGTYLRKSNYNITDLSKNQLTIDYKDKVITYPIIELDLDKDITTYTVITDDCEWLDCNGVIVAGAIKKGK